MGDSQVYEARRRAQGKAPLETFSELFGSANGSVRDEAFDAADSVPAKHEKAVRRILRDVARHEKSRRMPLTPAYRRSAKHYARAMKGALDHLEALSTHFDRIPTAITDTLELLRLLHESESARPRRPRGGQRLPHYLTGLAELRQLGIADADARALLRGLGLPIPSGPPPK